MYLILVKYGILPKKLQRNLTVILAKYYRLSLIATTIAIRQ